MAEKSNAGPFARDANIRISFRRTTRAVSLAGDADQLQIALNNLLRNAIESLAGTSPGSRRDIKVTLRFLKHQIELAVEDSGTGHHLPDPADTRFNSTKPKGTSLGLLVVRTTTENHGGRLPPTPFIGGAELRLIFPKPKEGETALRA